MPEIPKGYCECGCGAKTNLASQTSTKYGWVRGEPMRFVLGHARRSAPEDFIEDPRMDCWEWQLHRRPEGYGTCKRDGRRQQAHRYYYEMLVGPIPEGLTLDHLCRNPCCVNPGHLEPVTMGENVLRGNGWSGRNSRKTHCPAGHPLEGDNLIKTKLAIGQRACATCHRLRQHRYRKTAA